MEDTPLAETKPLKIPRWNDDLTNQTEPTEGEKDVGWVVDDQPPSSFFNWLQHFAGKAVTWLYERFDDGLIAGGGDSEDFQIHPPTPAGTGGAMGIKGADAVGDTTAGGNLDMRGGQANGPTSGNGGDATLDGGGVLAGSGNGGDVVIRGGTTVGTGGAGAVLVSGGASLAGSAFGAAAELGGGGTIGTDRFGGTATVSSGNATGDGSGVVDIKAVDAGQGAGTTVRSPSNYLKCDGPNKKIVASRTVEILPTGFPTAERGAMLLQGTTADPTTPAGAGEVHHRSDTSQLAAWDGSNWVAMNGLVFRQLVTSDLISDTAVRTVFQESASDIEHPIPVNSLRVGTVIWVKASGSYSITATPTLQIGLRIGSTDIVGTTIALAGAGGGWRFEMEMTIRTLGVAGGIGVGGLLRLGRNDGVVSDGGAIAIAGNAVIDTTAIQNIAIFADWGIADAANTIDLDTMTVRVE